MLLHSSWLVALAVFGKTGNNPDCHYHENTLAKQSILLGKLYNG
jgi:hypothetical protein